MKTFDLIKSTSVPVRLTPDERSNLDMLAKRHRKASGEPITMTCVVRAALGAACRTWPDAALRGKTEAEITEELVKEWGAARQR